MNRFLSRTLMATALTALTMTAQAAEPANDFRPTGKPIAVHVGQGTLLQLSGPLSNVFVANPEVADVQVPPDLGSRDLVYVFGKKWGQTSLYTVDPDGQVTLAKTINVTSRDVIVVRRDRTSIWTPEKGDGSTGSLSDLPAGSSLNVPVGGGKQ